MFFINTIPISGLDGPNTCTPAGSKIDLDPGHPDTVEWLRLGVILPADQPEPPADQPDTPADQPHRKFLVPFWEKVPPAQTAEPGVTAEPG